MKIFRQLLIIEGNLKYINPIINKRLILALKNIENYIMKIKVMKLTFPDNAFYAPQEALKDVKRC